MPVPRKSTPTPAPTPRPPLRGPALQRPTPVKVSRVPQTRVILHGPPKVGKTLMTVVGPSRQREPLTPRDIKKTQDILQNTFGLTRAEALKKMPSLCAVEIYARKHKLPLPNRETMAWARDLKSEHSIEHLRYQIWPVHPTDLERNQTAARTYTLSVPGWRWWVFYKFAIGKFDSLGVVSALDETVAVQIARAVWPQYVGKMKLDGLIRRPYKFTPPTLSPEKRVAIVRAQVTGKLPNLAPVLTRFSTAFFKETGELLTDFWGPCGLIWEDDFDPALPVVREIVAAENQLWKGV